MSTAAPSTLPPIAKPRRRRWWRVALLVAVLLFAAPLGHWWYTSARTRAAWEAAEAEAAADLPRWRLLELESDRPDIPDEENSAVFMMMLRRKNGAAVSSATNYDHIFEKLTPAAQLNPQQETLIRERLKLIAKDVDEAYKLKDMPRGRFPIQYSDDAISTVINHHQEGRNLIDWLQHDAYLRAHDGDIDKAVEACQAMVVASKAYETDLCLIPLLIRLAFQSVAVQTLERSLAQGQASDQALQAMQTALQREIDSGAWLQAIRGERAMMQHLFCNVRDGKVQLNGLFSMVAGPGPKGSMSHAVEAFLADHFPSTLLKYYPDLLRHHNRLVEIGKLPLHERRAGIEEWEAECKTTTNTLVRLLCPAVGRVHTSECRMQALMRCAAAAITCERYRLKDANKSWPESLDVLVQEKLLDAVPIDPFDGQPIRYRRTKDGIVVYSVGVDRKDDGGVIDRERPLAAGVDLGFQMWNVDRRRQAALPVVVFEKGE